MSLASLKELSFSWMSFIAGTASAVTSAAKAILSKKVLDGKPLGENLTPANMFAILSIIGAPATAAAAAAAAAALVVVRAGELGAVAVATLAEGDLPCGAPRAAAHRRDGPRQGALRGAGEATHLGRDAARTWSG